MRVLVVDDEPSLAELLGSVLRYEGWDVRTAGTGAGAVRTAREFRPDAAVLAAHGGCVTVTSRPGRMRFAIVLPLPAQPAPRAHARAG